MPPEETNKINSHLAPYIAEAKAQGEQARWTPKKSRFGTGEFLKQALSQRFAWIEPERSEDEEIAFDKLRTIEKVARNSIKQCYKGLDEKEKSLKLYNWMVNYIAQFLNDIIGRKFLFLDPYLPNWECVFERATQRQNIEFNLYFLTNFKFVLNPSYWAGTSVKYTIFIYYVFLTKRYVVFVESEQLYYQYIGTHWIVTNPKEIMDDLVAFASRLKIQAIDNVINTGTADRSVITRHKQNFTIAKWPFVSGFNFQNGFFTLIDNKYSLIPHGPGLWQKYALKIDLPNDIVTFGTPIIWRFIFDLTSENVVNCFLLQIICYCSVAPTDTHIIINMCGTPKGAKTTFLDLLKEILGPGYKTGNFNSLNSFQRGDLLNNAKVISFPDADPKNLDDHGKDVLRAISGRETIHVEVKLERNYQLRSEALIFITNNREFDEVPAFKDSGLSDRVLNFETPGIRDESSVDKLLEKIRGHADALILRSLPLSLEIIKKLQRSTQFNAVTSSGTNKDILHIILTRLCYQKGAVTKGADIYTIYVQHLAMNSPKTKPMPDKSFYRDLHHYLSKVTPSGATRREGSTRDGVVFENVVAVKDVETIKKEKEAKEVILATPDGKGSPPEKEKEAKEEIVNEKEKEAKEETNSNELAALGFETDPTEKKRSEKKVNKRKKKKKKVTAVGEPLQNFKFEGTPEMRALLTETPFRADRISFRQADGGYLVGPRLDPKFNQYTKKVLREVEESDLKTILEGPYKTPYKNHLLTTGFGDQKKIQEIRDEQYDDNEPFEYQAEVAHRPDITFKLTHFGDFSKAEWKPYFDGIDKPFVAINTLEPAKGFLTPYASEDFKNMGEYNFSAELFSKRKSLQEINQIEEASITREKEKLKMVHNDRAQLQTYIPTGRQITEGAIEEKEEIVATPDGKGSSPEKEKEKEVIVASPDGKGSSPEKEKEKEEIVATPDGKGSSLEKEKEKEVQSDAKPVNHSELKKEPVKSDATKDTVSVEQPVRKSGRIRREKAKTKSSRREPRPLEKNNFPF